MSCPYCSTSRSDTFVFPDGLEQDLGKWCAHETSATFEWTEVDA